MKENYKELSVEDSSDEVPVKKKKLKKYVHPDLQPLLR
jgi:hypothetical protein